MKQRIREGVVTGIIGLWLVACGEEEPFVPDVGATTAATSTGVSTKIGAGPEALTTADAGPELVVEFTDRDFVESDETRDPFRNFARLFLREAESRQFVQRKVCAVQYALDELRLTGIVTGSSARAMLTDPAGVGWVLRTGDYVGQTELVSTGGSLGADVPMNWRVDRIRAGDVVFLREDAAHPEIPAATRVMRLHPVDEATGALGAAATMP